MNLPAQYKWLEKEAAPRMIVEAMKEYGTIEVEGNGNNPKIIAWGKEISQSIANIYKSDSVPWCGLFMALIAKRADKVIPKDPLWALNWGTFGHYVECPMLGDVLVFTRNGGGHVSLYIGEDKTSYHCLGGNQSDSVCITRIAKNRLYMARRPDYKIEPENVRVVSLSATGNISTNEA